MANFTFLADKPEFSKFAKACIGAEEAFQNSPNDCVKIVRTAVASAVRWLYDTDSRFVKVNNPKTNEKESLFALTTTPTFLKAVGKKLSGKIHFCRTQGNYALHPEKFSKIFTNEESLKCLSYLFDFVQWIDKNYGKNYRPRSFDPEEVPVKDSDLKTFLKGAALVGVGFIGKMIFDVLTKDNN